MIHNQTSLPSIFHVERRALERVRDIFEEHGLSAGRAVILCGQNHSRDLAATVAQQLEGAVVEIVQDYSEGEAARLRSLLATLRATLIVAVGGGGVIDVAKRVSKLYGVSCLVVPSVVSNDGLMSPISVLKTKADRFDSLPAAMPIGVIADLDVVMSAPAQYLRASGGDLLSNLSATTDWRHVVDRGDGPRMNDISYHLSRNSAETLVHWRDCDVENADFVRNLIIAQIYSGIAMSIAGTSRPCSGPEHLISHALDELKLTPGVLHGVQVGSAGLFTLHLLDELSPAVVHFATAMQIPCCWTDLLPDPSQARSVLERARQVRPDRRTILDDFTDDQLLDELGRFAEAVGDEPRHRDTRTREAFSASGVLDKQVKGSRAA
jgi:glycerol-1-phosphate dehydrogenase [NAD(P)+]